MTLSGKNREEEIIDIPCAENGFVYQIEEVARCLRADSCESKMEDG